MLFTSTKTFAKKLSAKQSVRRQIIKAEQVPTLYVYSFEEIDGQFTCTATLKTQDSATEILAATSAKPLPIVESKTSQVEKEEKKEEKKVDLLPTDGEVAPLSPAPAVIDLAPAPSLKTLIDTSAPKKKVFRNPNGAVAKVWGICAANWGKSRKEILALCSEAGVAAGTSRTQYHAYKRSL